MRLRATAQVFVATVVLCGAVMLTGCASDADLGGDTGGGTNVGGGAAPGGGSAGGSVGNTGGGTSSGTGGGGSAQNRPPQVQSFTCNPMSGAAPLTSSCVIVASDPDGDALTCKLDRGADGTIEQTIQNCGASTSASITFATAGTIAVRLTVVDARQATAQSLLMFTVQPGQGGNRAPVITSFTATPASGLAPLTSTLSWLASDPDGDTMTCRVLEGSTVLGSAACSPMQTLQKQFALGSHTVTLEAKDSKGAITTQNVTVTGTSGTGVGDLRISKIEWGQSVIGTTPKLVPGKEALLRVHVLGDRAGIAGVVVKATGTKNGTTLGTLTLTGPSTPPTAEEPASLLQQWRATVPAAWVATGLTIVVKVDPDNALTETNEANNQQSLTPSVGAGIVLPITHVPVLAGGRTGTPKAIEQLLLQHWPLQGTTNQTRPTYTFSGTLGAYTGWDTLIDALDAVRKADNSPRYYYGWVSVTYNGGIAGIGNMPGKTAVGRDDSPSTAPHEIGHNLSRDHAPCNVQPPYDTAYPVSGARLDGYGWDYVAQKLIAPTTTYDLMSYCSPVWVSSYNYRAAQSYIESHPPGSAVSSGAPAMRVLVAGRYTKGHFELHPPVAFTGYGELEAAEPGSLTLTVRSNDLVRSTPLSLTQHVDGDDDEYSFAEVFDGLSHVDAITITQGATTLVDERASAAWVKASPVHVTPLEGGLELWWDPIEYRFASIAHLSGAERTTLSLWQEGGRAFISTAGLPEGGLFEVSLSDGLHTQRQLVARH